jgi:hypothetical protein
MVLTSQSQDSLVLIEIRTGSPLEDVGDGQHHKVRSETDTPWCAVGFAIVGAARKAFSRLCSGCRGAGATIGLVRCEELRFIRPSLVRQSLETVRPGAS